MTIQKKLLHNVTTGEIILRDETKEEIAAREVLELEVATHNEKIAANAELKAALLDKLGITADEAKMLLS